MWPTDYLIHTHILNLGNWINKLFSEVPKHCLELERWQDQLHIKHTLHNVLCFRRGGVALMVGCRWISDLCGCGCALLNEPCPCWRSCSSCTCTSHRRSSPGRPSVHPTPPPQTGSPPQPGGPDHSAHSWGRLKPNSRLNISLVIYQMYGVFYWYHSIPTGLKLLPWLLLSAHRAWDHVDVLGLLCQVFLKFPHKIHRLGLYLLHIPSSSFNLDISRGEISRCVKFPLSHTAAENPQ